MKEIIIACATRYKKEDTELWKSAQVLNKIGNFRWEFNENNTDGLSTVYNRYFNDIYRNKIVVFAHDDLLIEDLFFDRKLHKAHEIYDIVGLAGSSLNGVKIKDMNLKSPQKPALWHMMTPKDRMSGNVMHPQFEIHGNELVKGKQVHTTVFGPAPKKVDFMDGLFLSVNMEKALNQNVKFDEQFRFHHYDIDFTLSATYTGLCCGTWPIHVTHMSPGLRSFDERFLKSEEKFTKKYS